MAQVHLIYLHMNEGGVDRIGKIFLGSSIRPQHIRKNTDQELRAKIRGRFQCQI